MNTLTTSVCHCGARLDWSTGEIERPNCDEPCRFVMQKSGEGDPPIPTQDFIEGYRAGANTKEKKSG